MQYFGHTVCLKETIKHVLTGIKQILSCTLTTLLNRDLSVDKNSLSVSPTDKTLSEYIQTVDGQRLAGQHVSRLQTAFTGVSAEPGVDQGLVPSSGGHCAARYHAVVPATCKTINKLSLDILGKYYDYLTVLMFVYSFLGMLIYLIYSFLHLGSLYHTG